MATALKPLAGVPTGMPAPAAAAVGVPCTRAVLAGAASAITRASATLACAPSSSGALIARRLAVPARVPPAVRRSISLTLRSSAPSASPTLL
ncbi:hypothetical protein G6F58_013583 [Rhizopus delemar]|nr:hypothetical protein G6F58_013583 [Rhizopus delemar]